MNISSADFITSAVKPDQFPAPAYPEIAFAGRSNVGKSTLINTLVNRKGLVKTSKTPGRTQLINFFLINKLISFVDLPGYGYAKVPEAVKRNWKPMIESYLSGRESLKGVVLLMDIRRDPGVEERNLMAWLGTRGIPVLPVLTKADKFSKTQQLANCKRIEESLGRLPGDLILFSASTRQGKEEVWRELERLCALPPKGETV